MSGTHVLPPIPLVPREGVEGALTEPFTYALARDTIGREDDVVALGGDINAAPNEPQTSTSGLGAGQRVRPETATLAGLTGQEIDDLDRAVDTRWGETGCQRRHNASAAADQRPSR